MWRGVPFLYFNEKMADVISITKIPSVSIQSSFSWETIIAAFISGLVPAAISLYVIKKNNENVKRQQKQNNDNIKYQQKQEYNRHYSAYLRVVLSEYAAKVNKVKNAYGDFTAQLVGEPNLYKILLNAIDEMESAKASLLISLPRSSGVGLINSVEQLSSEILAFTKDESSRYRHYGAKCDIETVTAAYDFFIYQAKTYLSRYSFDNTEETDSRFL